MISFEKAVEIANELKANNGIISEYNNCYVFNAIVDDFSAEPLVVEKETGKDWNYPAWLGSPKDLESKYVISHRFVDGKWETFTDADIIDEGDAE